MLVMSVTMTMCLSYELPLTPAPVPDCSILSLGAEHYLLQPSLAHVVCGYAAFHSEVSRGDLPLRALIFTPGKHQLGNRVLELSTMMLLSMCTERALYLVWHSPSPISRHAQPVLFDWRMSAVTLAHPDVMNQSYVITKEDLIESLESEHAVLHYTLELGDYLLAKLQQSTCAPIVNRYFEVQLTLLIPAPAHAHNPSLAPLRTSPTAAVRRSSSHRGCRRCCGPAPPPCAGLKAFGAAAAERMESS